MACLARRANHDTISMALLALLTCLGWHALTKFAGPVAVVLFLRVGEAIDYAIILVIFSHACAGQPYGANDPHAPPIRLARHWLSDLGAGMVVSGFLQRHGWH